MTEEKKRANAPGNSSKYDYSRLEKHADSVITGKTIIFLGSSVTYGAAAEGQSFVELFEQLDGVNAIKEAKSGTTLVDKTSGDGRSYIKRLNSLDPEMHVDCVVCQLSTNDATMKFPLGEIGDNDTGTITGAIEYIINYCHDTWGCPVIFYTGSYYESAEYAAMVDRLYEIAYKLDVGIIDLYTDRDFNNISEDDYAVYMYDPIHPTRAGYSEWWMPKLEIGLKMLFER